MFVPILVFPTFDRMIFGRLSLLGQVRGDCTRPTNGARSEKVWEPLVLPIDFVNGNILSLQSKEISKSNTCRCGCQI